MKLGIRFSGLVSKASASGLRGISKEPVTSGQSRRGYSERGAESSGMGIEIGLSAMISSCDGRDGSAGSGGGGISAATGKLG